MADIYNPIIGSYSAIFELSVAMNFAYASSEHFREALKSGFLYNIRRMEQWYDEKRIQVSNKIRILSNEDIDQEKKDKIAKKLEDSLEQLKIEDNKLKDQIEYSQAKIADEIKPIYVYTALFSLIVLFFAGQENAHCAFPEDGVNTLIFLTTLFYPIVKIFKFFGYQTGAGFSIGFIIATTISSIFYPVSYSIPLPQKYLVDIAIIIAFLPFIFSAIRLWWLTIKIELRSRYNYYVMSDEIKQIEKYADNLRDSRDYFNNNL